MNIQATLEKMKLLRLTNMVRAYRNMSENGMIKNMLPDELLTHLVDTEYDSRQNNRLKILLKEAKLRFPVTVEYVDFSPERNLNKQEVLSLCECGYIEKNQNVCITGCTGTGKSYLVSVLGHHACLLKMKVRYLNCLKFFPIIHQSKLDGSYSKMLKNLNNVNLIILDDFGLAQMNYDIRIAVLEILDDKAGKGSVIVSSQLPFVKWHETIGDPTLADSICDRLMHKSIKIHLQGDSMRK